MVQTLTQLISVASVALIPIGNELFILLGLFWRLVTERSSQVEEDIVQSEDKTDSVCDEEGLEGCRGKSHHLDHQGEDQAEA